MFREKTSCIQGGGCRSPTSKRVGPSDFFCAKYPNLFSTPEDPKKIAWVLNSLCGAPVKTHSPPGKNSAIASCNRQWTVPGGSDKGTSLPGILSKEGCQERYQGGIGWMLQRLWKNWIKVIRSNFGSPWPYMSVPYIDRGKLQKFLILWLIPLTKYFHGARITWTLPFGSL